MPLPHDIYVDEAVGDDSANGTEGQPLASLSAAVQLRAERLQTSGGMPVRIFTALYFAMGRKWEEPFDEALNESS